MVERRRYERLKVEELQSKCRIDGSRRSLSIDVFDLTPAGLGFVCNSYIKTGQEIEIELSIEDETIFCKGLVCWSKPDVIDRNKVTGGMRLLVPDLRMQSKLLISYTNKLLSEYPLPSTPEI